MVLTLEKQMSHAEIVRLVLLNGLEKQMIHTEILKLVPYSVKWS
jgi:hypothetical protein